MRLKSVPVLSFEWLDDSLPKTVLEYRAKYQAISAVLDENPEVLTLVHEDLHKLSEGGRRGRKGDYTSENILRGLVVMSVEGLALRKAVVRIAESPFLQDFLRMDKRAVMDFTFLDKCFKAITPETWKRVNEVLGAHAVAEEEIDPSVIRIDTTVVEANIHYPTDTSLLWDSWRVLARLLRHARDLAPESCPHRFHDKKVRNLHLFITRFASSSSKARQRKVKATFRKLIARVGWIVDIAEGFCAIADLGWDILLLGIAEEIKGFLPAIRTVVENAERAQLRGETVPARERVFSIFEPHVELIKRGKKRSPVEFGHMVALSQTREKFITDYQVFEKRVADCELTEPIIERHKALFGSAPDVVAGDKGFSPNAKARAKLEELVETLAIPRRLRDFADALLAKWQAFRAGIEGTISALKRAFRLFRCFYRGFKSFASGVGMGVFAHNLVVLAARRQ